MEAQGQHDPKKSTFLEREVRSKTSSDKIRVGRRMISVTELLLKFMMQTQGILAKQLQGWLNLTHSQFASLSLTF